jgi:hypothetical protein
MTEPREIQANPSKLLSKKIKKNEKKTTKSTVKHTKQYKTNPITCECGKKMLEKNLRFHIVTNYHTSRVGNR